MRGDGFGFGLILALRVALLPVLVVQAMSVRRRALRLPEAGGLRAGVTGRGHELGLLILGDSSAAGVGVAMQDMALSGSLTRRLAPDHRVTWHVLARTGATTRDAIRWLEDLPEDFGRFDTVVVALGVNDVTRAVPLRVWLARQHRLIALLQDRVGARRIYLSGVPPMGAFPVLPQPLRWVLGHQAARFDRHLQRLVAPLPQVHHVPLDFGRMPGAMAEDGFHPGPAIYDRWAAILDGYLRRG